jgi:hypothetical protein
MSLNLTKSQIQSLIELLNSSIDSEQPDNFEQKIEERTAQVLNQRIKNIEKIEKFNALFMVALEPHVGQELAEYIVNCLNEGRNSCNGYYTVAKAYHKLEGDLHKRNMLKLVRALYQRHYESDKKIISRLNSEIKTITACDHCGQIAQQIKEYIESNF